MTGNPPRRGVYALVIQVTRDIRIRVGRLGRIEFRSGIYVYIGSALNSLQGRIRRHYTRGKKRHWHIDYLTSSNGVKLLRHAVRSTSRQIECSVSKAVEENAKTSIYKFGSSDCHCYSPFTISQLFMMQHAYCVGKDFGYDNRRFQGSRRRRGLTA